MGDRRLSRWSWSYNLLLLPLCPALGAWCLDYFEGLAVAGCSVWGEEGLVGFCMDGGLDRCWLGLSVPCMGDDNVVEWGVTTPEARKSQFDDHFEDMWCWLVECEEVGGLVAVFSAATMGCKMLKVRSAARFRARAQLALELSILDQSYAL